MIPTTRFDFASQPHRRAATVWGAFVATMTIVGGLLLLGDPAPAPRLGLSSPALDVNLEARPIGTIFDTATALKRDQWLEIIIEDTGSQHGSVEGLARNAQTRGLKGLGDHFIIGNGNGMGDGDLHMSYRWNTQMSATGNNPADSASESRVIRICVVGNVRNRPFTDRQLERLAALVAGLQEEFRIPSSRIRFAGPLLDAESGGEHFDQRAFARLLADARQSG